MNERKSKTTIGAKLLRILIAMVTATIVFIIAFLGAQARSIIIDLATTSLESDSGKNAANVGVQMTNILYAFDHNINVINSLKLTDKEKMQQAMERTLDLTEMVPNGLYGGLENGTWIDPSGWEPDADYVIVERDWYKQALGHPEFVMGEPYVDASTGTLIVTASKEVTLANGTKGVFAADFELNSIVDAVSQYKPLGKGISMLFFEDYILSCHNAEYNGSRIADHPDDALLNQILPHLDGNYGLFEIKANGTTYYLATSEVAGTPWTMVSLVSKSDVLKSMNTFQVICFVLMVVMVILIAIVMLMLTKRYISVPVAALIDNIEHITKGDFSVEINCEGNDEIGVMNRCMNDYVTGMRKTLGEMQTVTNKLSNEAQSSQSASGNLNVQAEEQSKSMEQIRDTMNGISDSVNELAENATTLAHSVLDLTEKGNNTSKIMEGLLKQADKGKSDMETLKSSMSLVSDSMSDMNDVVLRVDESAQKINSIVEMINSISSQTNLLSLNASIEAARAGEAGKGFAVVADEIGKLANESSSATTEISNIIADITEQIKNLSGKAMNNMDEITNGAEAVAAAEESFGAIFRDLDETGSVLSDMMKNMNQVNDIASSVAAISEEQSASTVEVTSTVEKVVDSAVQVASESHDVDISARTVADSAEKIGDFVNTFKIE
ncbi:MAG: methyl-accepting chemotaxis protein [Butyrivibrio sp.]|nr:methyl-accepting chemotaxis protein [Butyrivibrio sp.]